MGLLNIQFRMENRLREGVELLLDFLLLDFFELDREMLPADVESGLGSPDSASYSELKAVFEGVSGLSPFFFFDFIFCQPEIRIRNKIVKSSTFWFSNFSSDFEMYFCLEKINFV